MDMMVLSKARVAIGVVVASLCGCRAAPSVPVAEYPAVRVEFDNSANLTVKGKPEVQVRTVSFGELAQPVAENSVSPSERPSEPPPVTSGTSRLTLAELEDVAFRHNPTLEAAAARMEAARGKQVQSGLYPNPVVGYHGTQIGNLGSAGAQGAFMSQRFITGGKLALDQAIAGKEFDAAHFRFHVQELRVLSDVRVRFYDALVAQERVELTEELARIGDDLLRATQTLLDGRLATENDLLQAQIRSDEAQIHLDNARNQEVEAWRRLAAVIGTPRMALMPVDGDLGESLPALDWDDCYATVMDGNPELNAARTQVDRLSLAIERAKREPIPNVDFFVSVRHQNVTQSDVANVQIGIPIPIFDRNQGRIRSAEADWNAARNEVCRIELDLQDRLAVAYRKYANARQQVERYRGRIVPAARKSLELVTGGYEKGQVEYLTLLTAQQTNLQVNLSHLRALQELRAAEASIQGQLLTGSLQSTRTRRP